MTNVEYATSLRAIADWYETHPEIAVPPESINVGAVHTKDDARLVARAFGACRKEYDSTMFVLSRVFGAVNLRFLFWRSEVCTRRVIGTQPVAERVIPAHTEEIVEWDCDPLLTEEPVAEPA